MVNVALCPMLLVTTTFTGPAGCEGVVTLIVLLSGSVTLVPAIPPNVTVAPGRKPVPVIFTNVPPLAVPELGEMPLTVNAGLVAVWPRNVAICVTQGADRWSDAVAL